MVCNNHPFLDDYRWSKIIHIWNRTIPAKCYNDLFCSYLLLSVHFQRPKTAADVVGGYTYEFIDQPPGDLLCQMCNYVAKEPQQMKCCGTLYCKSCLARIMSNPASRGPHARCCVKCKSKSFDHFLDQRSNERIQKLMVECTNQGQGCDWIGELKDLDDHRSQCPKEEIPCTFSEVGCKIRPMRGDLVHHIKQDQQQHLDCAVTSVLRLRQELATTQGKLQETRTLPTIFKMSNYAQFKKTGDVWYSTPFCCLWSECRLRLCVQLQPKQSSYSWKFGVLLELLSSPMTPMPHMPISNSLTVELLNQVGDTRHHKISLILTSSSKSCVFDLSHLFGHTVGPSIQYVCDDCLFFRVSENKSVEKPWLVDPTLKKS